MSHKLLITTQIAVKAGGLEAYLKKGELVRGGDANFTFILFNIGTEPFPGGILSEAKAEITRGVGHGLAYTVKPDTKIEQILPGKPGQPLEWQFEIALEGLAWISLKLKANDNQTIDIFSGKEDQNPTGTNEWRRAFIVVNREEVMTVKLLTELNSKIDALLKKK